MIDKAELERDLAQFTTQVTMLSGVIQYISGKIKQLEASKEVKDGDDNALNT